MLPGRTQRVWPSSCSGWLPCLGHDEQMKGEWVQTAPTTFKMHQLKTTNISTILPRIKSGISFLLIPIDIRVPIGKVFVLCQRGKNGSQR